MNDDKTYLFIKDIQRYIICSYITHAICHLNLVLGHITNTYKLSLQVKCCIDYLVTFIKN